VLPAALFGAILFAPIAHADTLFPLPSIYIEQTQKVSPETNPILCSCVLYLRSLGLDVRGDAALIPSNTTFADAKPGDAILLTYDDKETGNSVGHVAEILSIDGTTIKILESNFVSCKSDERTISATDSHLRGFYSLKPQQASFLTQHTTNLP